MENKLGQRILAYNIQNKHDEVVKQNENGIDKKLINEKCVWFTFHLKKEVIIIIIIDDDYYYLIEYLEYFYGFIFYSIYCSIFAICIFKYKMQ